MVRPRLGRQTERRIAFTSRHDGNPETYVMNADGSGVTRLTYNRTRDSFLNDSFPTLVARRPAHRVPLQSRRWKTSRFT